MTDPLDRLRQPVEPLAAPSGTFDAVLARAGRRRAVRTAAVAALATVIIVGGGGLVFVSGHPISGGRLEGPAVGGRSAAPSSGPSRTFASAAPRSRQPTAPSAAALALPHGPVPHGLLPYSVTSVGGGVTYLLGDAPCRAAPCTSVVRSVDGGRTWVGVPAPRAPLPGWQDGGVASATTVRDLRFASVRDGWAYGGAVYVTHDAARTWKHVDVGGTVLDLATDGTTTYAVVAACDARGFGCTNARLRSTPASGDQWQDVPGVGGGTGGQISLSGGRGVGLLTGGGSPARLFVRSGSGWRRVTPPSCPTGLSAATTSASSPRLFAFCGEGAAGSLYLTTYSSDAEGRDWRRQPGSALQLANGTLLTTAAATSGVLFATSLSPGFPNAVARSGDGGRTWADASVPDRPGGWRYVGARSASSIVALPGEPDGSVWSSRDGGVTWTAYRFP